MRATKMQRKNLQEVIVNDTSDVITILTHIENEIQDVTSQLFLNVKKSSDHSFNQIIEKLEIAKQEISHITEKYKNKQENVLADLKLNVNDTNIDPNFNQLLLEEAEQLSIDKDILFNYIKSAANGITIELNIEDQKKIDLLDTNEKNYLIKKYIEFHVQPELKSDETSGTKIKTLSPSILPEEKTGLKNLMQYYKFFFANLPHLENKIIALESSVKLQNILEDANKLTKECRKALTRLNGAIDRAIQKSKCTQWGELSVLPLKLKKQLFIIKCEFESTMDGLTEDKEDNLYEAKSNLVNKIELILSLPALLVHKLNSILSLWPEMNLDCIKKQPTILKNAPGVVHFLLDCFRGCELSIDIKNADYILCALSKHEDELEVYFPSSVASTLP